MRLTAPVMLQRVECGQRKGTRIRELYKVVCDYAFIDRLLQCNNKEPEIMPTQRACIIGPFSTMKKPLRGPSFPCMAFSLRLLY